MVQVEQVEAAGLRVATPYSQPLRLLVAVAAPVMTAAVSAAVKLVAAEAVRAPRKQRETLVPLIKVMRVAVIPDLLRMPVQVVAVLVARAKMLRPTAQIKVATVAMRLRFLFLVRRLAMRAAVEEEHITPVLRARVELVVGMVVPTQVAQMERQIAEAVAAALTD